MLEYIKTRKYIVTVNDYSDLDAIYDEIESLGKAPPNTDVLRAVECVERRPTSRNTIYRLTDWEAAEIAKDPRVKAVTIHPSEVGIQAGLNAITQTSSNWSKASTEIPADKNWGLLRCTEGQQRTNWGGSGYQGNGTGTSTQTGTITLSQTGKNVDVVVCDENGIVWNHPEYAKNADGTGGTRTIQYNWEQHNAEIGYGANGTYSYGTGSHSSHVAGTVAGNTQGWARDANIYNIFYLAGDPSDYTFPWVMDYIRAFHRNKQINTNTGIKNPTIVNNSWGMSIFPSEWSFNDITAVTYRGTRYVAGNTTTFTGYSGICTDSVEVAPLPDLEYAGNRIVTTGSYVAPIGAIVSSPASWTVSGQQAYYADFVAPAATYQVEIQGPAVIDLINNVAVDAITGSMSLFSEIVVTEGSTVIDTFSEGPKTTTNGGSIETDVRVQSYNLLNNSVYTISFNTTLDTTQASSLTHAVGMSATVLTGIISESASVSPITNQLLGAGTLSVSTTPTAGSNDDGYWLLNLPFPVEYFGTNYTSVGVGTNMYLTFGAGSSIYTNLDQTTPNIPKISMCADDRSVQRIYYGTEGLAPNRTYRIRVEGHTSYTGGSVGFPTVVYEYVFYEATPDQIDLQIGANGSKQVTGSFTSTQLNNWGFISGQRIPARVSALDADLEDAYDEGIIMVGAAGNGRWKHCLPSDPDWNNTFEMANRYPASVVNPYYYMRGTSPTANDTTANGGFDLPAICVGSIDTIQIDQKVLYSDCGTGVDIWAPGTYIMSVLPSGVSDPRNASYYLGKYSGTSMASPQVCGVLACALEIYPHMKQEQAKEYILSYAKVNQITATSGGPTDGQDLQGAPNKFLYYYTERPTSGLTYPKVNYKARTATGAVYPRPRRRKTLR